MPDLSLKLGKPIKIERADASLTVAGQGELLISQGSVEWRPAGNYVNGYRMTWKQFAEAMVGGTEVRFAAKKVAVKKKTPVKKAAK